MTRRLDEEEKNTTRLMSTNKRGNPKEGKHFYLLTGETLKEFKNANREFQGSLNRLYLWTEKGACHF